MACRDHFRVLFLYNGLYLPYRQPQTVNCYVSTKIFCTGDGDKKLSSACSLGMTLLLRC